MGLNKIINSPYFRLSLKITQETPCNLPYYGTVLRGWMGDAFYHDKKLMQKIFKNPKIDVRPYFHHTFSNGNTHMVNLIFIGYATRYTREIVEAISEKHISHIGGVPARIEVIKYEESNFTPLPPSKEVRVKFASPTSVVENGKILHGPPSLDLLLKSVIRSVNRFCKYYFKSAYPVHIKNSQFPKSKHAEFEISPFSWVHKTMHSRTLKMDGITGVVTYRMREKPSSEVMKILALTQAFQVGKWTTYGFGKLEVNT